MSSAAFGGSPVQHAPKLTPGRPGERSTTCHLVELTGLVAALEATVFMAPLERDVTPFALVLIPGMLEELGWRGFAVQTALDGGRSPVWATMAVGGLFFLFHVPLYLPGHMFHGLPFRPLPLTLLSSAVSLTWMYQRTGSVLVTGLMHAAFNATTPLAGGLDPRWVWQTRSVVLTVLAAALGASGQQRTSRSRRGQRPTPPRRRS